MQNSDYSEWVPMGNLVKGLVAMVVSLVVFITATILFFGGITTDSLIAIALNWIVIAFILVLIWNYRGLRIQISSGELAVEYGFFNKKTFQLKDLISCKVSKSTFGRYWGIGVRFSSDGSVAYTTSFGEAVEVVPKVGRTFVFSSHKPARVCDIIRRNKEKGA